MSSRPAKSRDEDLLTLEECRRRGDDLSLPIATTHFFSLASRQGPEPAGAGEEIEAMGFHIHVIEELSGDGYWHIAAIGTELVSADGLAKRRTKMESLARRHQLTYDGWEPTTPSGGAERSPRR